MKAGCIVVALALVGAAEARAEESAEESAEVSAQEDIVVEIEKHDRIAAARDRVAEAAKELAAAVRANPRRVWRGGDRAFLGVLIGEQGEEGIQVASVSPDGGAADAGIEADDVIVAINGKSLVGDDEPVDILHEILAQVDPGDAVDLVILRDDETMPIEVVTTEADIGVFARRFDDLDFDFDWRERRPYRFQWRAHHPRAEGRDGLRLVDIGEDLGDYFGVDAGVLVLDTPARSEFKPGDILKRIDGAAVSSAADGYRLLRRLAEDAQAEVRRKNRKVMVGVAASGPHGDDGKCRHCRHGEEVEVEEH